MNLILLSSGEPNAQGMVLLSDSRATHIRTILRATPGQTLRIGLIDGPLGTATVESDDVDGIRLRCRFEATPPPRPRVDLLLAVPRPKVLRRLWAQLAALGVGRIILSAAWKVEKPYFDTHILDPDIYTPLLVEGLQQAGDTHLPEVSLHRRFKVLIEDDLDRLFPEGARLLADPSATISPREALPPDFRGRVLLAVGPEGGWTEYERRRLAERGFTAMGLGLRTLRTDTACIALMTLVHDALRSPIPACTGRGDSG